MGTVSATFEVPVARDVVFRYLRGRYESDVFRKASLDAKGYVPPVHCLSERQNEELRFSVAARDTLTRIPMGSWTWSYRLYPAGDAATVVRISYEWNWFLSLLTMWTARHQAANELTETALALEALAWSPPQAGGA